RSIISPFPFPEKSIGCALHRFGVTYHAKGCELPIFGKILVGYSLAHWQGSFRGFPFQEKALPI
ncbi:MAG: hypothetical protein ABIJ26_08505, partial [Candidatus Margulisiibacteriota bacterium]